MQGLQEEEVLRRVLARVAGRRRGQERRAAPECYDQQAPQETVNDGGSETPMLEDAVA